MVLKLLHTNFNEKKNMDKINYPDIYFTPQYAELFAKVDGGKVISFHHCSLLGEVYYSFILRPIFVNGEQQDYSDIITPYGYGGPIILSCENSEKQKLLKSFDIEFSKYCADNRIISEFVRFHPLFNNVEYCKEIYMAEFNRYTVVIDLTTENPEMDSFTSQCRNKIRLAEKNGVSVEFDFIGNSINEFHRLYTLTMQKNNAKNYYFFDEKFFKEMMIYFKNHIFILSAIYKNEMIGTAMFMYHNRFMHYHFSATNPLYYRLACNNLILSTAAKWGKLNGITLFHLGGGYTTNCDDSLLVFKKSFSKKGLCDFWIGKRIHNYEAYQKLVALTYQYQTFENQSFFPLYRK
jgi:hypothetical protein